jgi:hypothetical protein
MIASCVKIILDVQPLQITGVTNACSRLFMCAQTIGGYKLALNGHCWLAGGHQAAGAPNHNQHHTGAEGKHAELF